MDKIIPKVSVITVVYNGISYIEKTIQNILHQSYENIEYIIIDGGSTDGTIDIIKKYDNQIDYWISKKDQGIYDAMNKGVALSSGDWINFMNAGDSYTMHTSIENIIYPLEDLKNINFIYSNYLLDNIKTTQKYSRFTFLRKNICHQSIFYHRSIIANSNFNINLVYAADYDHIIQNYDKIKPLHRNDYLVKYDSTGISSNTKNLYKIWKERYLVLKKSNFPFLIKSFFMLYAWCLYKIRNINE